MSYHRPPFWRVPHQRRDPEDENVRDFGQRRRYVTPGTPAGRDLVRGDIIAKIDDYDARDLRHEDAQNLFKNAPNQIKLVVQRGGTSPHVYSVPRVSSGYVGRIPTPTFYHELAEDADREGPRGASAAPRSPIPNVTASPYYRTPSPACRGPESLPRTPLPLSFPPQVEGEYRYLLSPSSVKTDDTFDESLQSQSASPRSNPVPCTPALSDQTMAYNPNTFFPNGYQDPMHPEEEVVTNWPYRTTPLVLPGAKVRREPGPTESYLRHHPNPAMRAPPSHDYRDTLMKQKVAESVLQRVVGEEAGNKVVHKQFNSPINMYSDANIANSIRQHSSPVPHKPTVLYDPAKSETFRALQTESLGDVVQEVPVPVQTKVFQPTNKRSAPTPKPTKKIEAKQTNGKRSTFVNALNEDIQQSNSFKRLMYNVLGDAEF